MNEITNAMSEPVITTLGAVLGGLWTFFKATDWYQRAKEQRFAEALVALEAGVQQTYDVYVRAVKDSSSDGKLSSEERRRARELARDAAIAFGRTKGVDVLNTIGQNYIDVWITKLVNQKKHAAR
ncbi:MAG TPA: hypothetical protein PK869_12955 [Candidatus Hydrogenedentes bacterium]|nr:hypothetical protein [Candidatus Hydrogenedentota bacterium]